MGKTRLEQLLEKPTIGYWSILNGVEIKEIGEEYAETYVYCVSGAWGGGKQAHRLKVFYNNNGDTYVNLFNNRLYLNEAIRC